MVSDGERDASGPSKSTAEARNPLQAIHDALGHINGSAVRRVAEWLLANPESAGRATITEVAEAAGTDPTSVTRLARRLGYEGFPALRSAIATEHGRDLQAGWQSDFGAVLAIDDPPDRVLRVLARAEMKALRNALAGVDLQVATEIADVVSRSAHIHIFGAWGDGIAAKELALRLLRIGRPAWWHESAESAYAVAETLRSDDVALVFSRTGRGSVPEDFVARAVANGARTVVITGEPQSPLADQAELVLFTGTRAARNWTEYVAGRASDSLVANFLVVLVSQQVPNETRYRYPFESHDDDTAEG